MPDPGRDRAPRRVPEGLPRPVRWLAAVAVVAAVLLGLWFFYVPDGPQGARPVAAAGGHRDAAVIPWDPASRWSGLDDPGEDGWDTEVFTARASKQLKRLGEVLGRGGAPSAGDVEGLAAPGFRCGRLRPERPVEAYRGSGLVVRRGPADGEGARPWEGVPAGPGTLAAALRDLLEPHLPGAELQLKFKPFRVHEGADSVTTEQYVALSGPTAGGSRELNATWTIRWTRPADGEEPLLESIAVTDFEEVHGEPARPRFADCTAAVLGDEPSYAAQVLRGFGEFLGRSQVNRGIVLMGMPGLALGDVDGDGREDLYLCQEGGLPNQLYVHEAGDTAREASAEAGVDWLDCSRSALLVDLDNDGDPELTVATPGALLVAENDGSGRFELWDALPLSEDPTSHCAADPDLDGDLDLYVCAYDADRYAASAIGAAAGGGVGFVFHDSNAGGANSLYRNDTGSGAGNGALQGLRFADATFVSGLDRNNRRYSFAAGWEDLDNDGDPDLYVANDFGRNNHYRNEGGQGGPASFRDVAAETGAEDSASGMSVAFGDLDRDGWMDVYVGNMFSAAGGRIAFQERFKSGAGEVKRRIQRFARGNTLLRNLGGEGFADVSVEAAVTLGRWAWGSSCADLNNDGWEDLVVANGYITTDDPDDL